MVCKDDVRLTAEGAYELGYCLNCSRGCFDPIGWAKEQDDAETIMDFIETHRAKLYDSDIERMTEIANELE